MPTTNRGFLESEMQTENIRAGHRHPVNSVEGMTCVNLWHAAVCPRKLPSPSIHRRVKIAEPQRAALDIFFRPHHFGLLCQPKVGDWSSTTVSTRKRRLGVISNTAVSPSFDLVVSKGPNWQHLSSFLLAEVSFICRRGDWVLRIEASSQITGSPI